MQYLYFTAEWCAPCKQIKPLVISSGKSIQIIDVDSNPTLKSQYKIMSVPTLIIVNDTGATERLSGTSQILSFLNK